MTNMGFYLLVVVLIFGVAMGQVTKVIQHHDDDGEPIEVIPLSYGSDRIIGGQLAENGSRPWQALVLLEDGLCGGTVIASQYVLTAAHCLPMDPNSIMTIMVGSNKRCSYVGGQRNVDYGAGSILRTVSDVYTNNFNIVDRQNDIAILKLDSPVPLNGTIMVAQLPTSLPQAGETLELSGWGTTTEGGIASCDLMTVSVPVVDCAICKSIYGPFIGDHNFCAGPMEGGKGFCMGDDGGPLVKLGCNGPILYGVVSFSNGCAGPNFPGVYTKVFHFVSWINSII